MLWGFLRDEFYKIVRGALFADEQIAIDPFNFLQTFLERWLNPRIYRIMAAAIHVKKIQQRVQLYWHAFQSRAKLSECL